jgi:hypothetical protein
MMELSMPISTAALVVQPATPRVPAKLPPSIVTWLALIAVVVSTS